jgi:hypothetical protein
MVVVLAPGQVGTCAHRPVQPHWPGLFGSPPQVCGAVQLPHWRVPLQPSPAGPQVTPCDWQVSAAQPSGLPPTPQTLGLVAPQVWPIGQSPHMRMPPHLVSVAGPQLAPRSMHVEWQPTPPPPPKLSPPSAPPAALPVLMPLLAPPEPVVPNTWLFPEHAATAPAAQPPATITQRTLS